MTEKIYNITTTKNIKSSKKNDSVDVLFKSARDDATRSYQAAKTSRLVADFLSSNNHINDDILNAMNLLRSRARSLSQNDSTIQNYLSKLRTNINGSNSFTLNVYTENEVLNDLIKLHFKNFSKRNLIERSCKHTLKSLIDLIISSVAIDGECLLIKDYTVTDKNKYGFSLRVVNIDKLDINYNQVENEKNEKIIMGIKLDKFNKPISYFLNENNVNSIYNRSNQSKRIEIKAEDVYHIFKQEYIEQVRGITWLSSVMENIHLLATYEKYTLIASKLGASKTGFFVKEKEDASDLSALADSEDSNEELILEAEPGIFQMLPPGWKFQEFKPDYPASTYKDYIISVKKAIASGLKINYNSLYSDLSEVNYSSIRQGELTDRDMFKSLQKFIIEDFLNVLFVDFIKNAFINNTIKINNKSISETDLFNVLNNFEFSGRAWAWIDPKNDIESAKIALEMGILSPKKIAENMGEDIYTSLDDTAKVKEYAKKLGLNIHYIYNADAQAQSNQEVKNLSVISDLNKTLITLNDNITIIKNENLDLQKELDEVKNLIRLNSMKKEDINITVERQDVNINNNLDKKENDDTDKNYRVITKPIFDQDGFIIDIESRIFVDENTENIEENTENIKNLTENTDDLNSKNIENINNITENTDNNTLNINENTE